MRLKTTLGITLVAAVLALVPAKAEAYPMLQLDASGGFYVGGAEETIFSSGPVFTLYALKDGAFPTANLFVSVALVPQTAPPGGAYGSFTFNGQLVNVTGDMVYGVPPLEANLGFDAGDLSQHGVFETYFSEFRVPTDYGWYQVGAYDTAEDPGGPLAGAGMWAAAMALDASGLADGYALHFDLYSEKVRAGGDIDRDDFAPFSHDAETGTTTTVPEPASLLLMGTGLAVAASRLRRRK